MLVSYRAALWLFSERPSRVRTHSSISKQQKRSIRSAINKKLRKSICWVKAILSTEHDSSRTQEESLEIRIEKINETLSSSKTGDVKVGGRAL